MGAIIQAPHSGGAPSSDALLAGGTTIGFPLPVIMLIAPFTR